ncbi:MAG: hypothetical protein HKL95_05345 [Phycisphaerae bacterium]|nr:hypothetical protein [Phycisphaerae bacterium]
MNTMPTRERFHAVMNFKPFDRLQLLKWAPWWDQALARWHTKGLLRNCTDRYEICCHFNPDIFWQDWLPVRRAGCPQPAAHGTGMVASLADYQRLRLYLYPTVEELRDRAIITSHFPAGSFGRWRRCSLLTDPRLGYARRSRLVSSQNYCAVKPEFIFAQSLTDCWAQWAA